MTKRRFFATILVCMMTALTLTGCSFFSHDYERDYQQEIARVNSYTITNPKSDKDGEYVTDADGNIEYSDYKTATKIIYKYDLVEYVNNNGSSMASSFSSMQELYEYAADMLVNVELVTNEVDALIESGTVHWGLTEQNNVRKNIYSIVDNTLHSLMNTILDERDQPQYDFDNGTADSTSTTYPTKPEETDDEEETAEDTELWQPERILWPGINGDSDRRSLEREAMRRFLALVQNRVKDDFRLNMSERKWLGDKIKKEIKAINDLIDTQGIEYVYPVIGTYSYPMKESDSEYGYMMYYLSGESIERSQKISALQKHLSDSVTVNYDEVESSYKSMLNEQRSLYQDVAAYDSAMSGSSTVLYHPNNNYFYVKHILLPFSDVQKDALTAFGNRSDIKNLQKDEKEERVHEFRADLAESIVCYQHKDGEDDTTRPMSVDDVMAHIRSAMSPLAGNVKAANDKFNDLIYLYNTDPGAFDNDKGYIVKYKLNDGESETYMQEFADAARDMYDTLEPGQVYYQKVITDYGVHIMYLSSVVSKGAVSLNDYTSPNGNETYYDLLEQPILSSRESAAYDRWEREVLMYNYNKYAKIYVEKFSDLWKK